MTRNSPNRCAIAEGGKALPLIMKRPDWPEPDRAAWDALFAEGGIFDGAGPCAYWAEGSRRKRAQSYGHWLGFLTRSGRFDEPRDVTERATPDAVRAFVENELARCSMESTYIHLDDLYVVLRAMNPAKDWTWLASIVERLRVRCRHGELKPRASVSASQISDWARRRTNIDNLADQDRQEIIMTYNLTPRKCLGYLTPIQALFHELGRDVRLRFA